MSDVIVLMSHSDGNRVKITVLYSVTVHRFPKIYCPDCNDGILADTDDFYDNKHEFANVFLTNLLF